MFTMKKGIFAKSIALILVIIMISAFALTACSDKDAQKAADDANTAAGNAQSTANDALSKAEANAAELAKKVEELQKAITALEEKDGAKLEALEKELAQAKKDLADALIDKENWDKATEVLAEKANELSDVYDKFLNNKALYGNDELKEASNLANEAKLALTRAYSVEQADAVIAALKAALDDIPTIPESLKAVLDEIAENGIEYPEDGKLLEKAKDLIDKSIAADLYDEITSYGDDEENLEDTYNDYKAEYMALGLKKGGAALKDRMDAVIADDITLAVEATVNSIVNDFEEWTDWVIENAGADTEEEKTAAVNAKIAAVDGFAATIDAFDDVIARITELKNAKTAAEPINAAIDALLAAGIKADPTTSAAIKSIKTQIENWSKTYNIPVDEAADNYIKANADLIKNDTFASIQKAFDERTKAFKAAFEEFVNAVNAIGTVTPDSGDAINAAWKAYFKCAALNQISDLDAILGNDDNESVKHYYAKLTTADRTYQEILALIDKIESEIDALSKFDVQYKFADDAAKTEYDAKVAKITSDIAAIDADIKVLTETYKQDKSVIDAAKLAALDDCRLIPAKDAAVKAIVAAYEAKIATVTGDEEEDVESKKLKLQISEEQQINYVLGIKFADTFGTEGNVTSLEEIARCGTTDYINAQFTAALEFVPATTYNVNFKLGTDGSDLPSLGKSVGTAIKLPEGPVLENKVFKGWKASETAPVLAAGTVVPVSQDLTFTAVYVDGTTVGDFTLTAGSTKEILNVAKSGLDKVVVEFTFAQNGTVSGDLTDNAVLTVNGKRTLRVSGGNATHCWNEATGVDCGNAWWGYQGGSYPDTKIQVRVTIDVATNTITVDAGWGVFDATSVNRTWTITDDGTYLGGDNLVLSFGGANTKDLTVVGCTITY